MKRILNLLFVLLLYANTFAQKIQTVLHGIDSDSSFYHIAKINNNEFWIGGEYGILKTMDTLGNVSNIKYDNVGLNILKIERVNNYVFIATDDAVIYRYDIEKKVFIKKEFPEFKGKCFYDLIALSNGKLMVCGGTKGIAKATKKLPKGFIAIVDMDLNTITTVWKNYRKFVWSLLELDNHKILASTYNGLSTKIIETTDFKHWKTNTQVKGLVHEIALIDNQVWYCGSKNNHYKNEGIIGLNKIDHSKKVICKTGCIWSMDILNDKIISVTQSGELLKLDKVTNEFELLKIPDAFTLYDIQKISNKKIVVIGHGHTAYILDFN